MLLTLQLSLYYCVCFDSNPALLEGLEIDQYLWGVIQSITGTECDMVTIDSSANWRPLASASKRLHVSNANRSLPGSEDGTLTLVVHNLNDKSEEHIRTPFSI